MSSSAIVRADLHCSLDPIRAASLMAGNSLELLRGWRVNVGHTARLSRAKRDKTNAKSCLTPGSNRRERERETFETGGVGVSHRRR